MANITFLKRMIAKVCTEVLAGVVVVFTAAFVLVFLNGRTIIERDAREAAVLRGPTGRVAAVGEAASVSQELAGQADRLSDLISNVRLVDADSSLSSGI